ncbi:TRAP transporter small permease [Aliiruegeria lutimaris]|uniref:TRAP transporter small permease protein n=1 Tax=Aliiruegeria lutimaris TaxID=571298 RepID=A0A1G8PAC8_9RHOB|nr:TRAP transporter small permease subunit [Aliiruegeria lutimaris]SDI89268.1 TRAP-type C4-dicarboxylate transport system, small permease component [Aliiruegeria lutimaris]
MSGHGRYSIEGYAATVLFLGLIFVVLLQVFGRSGFLPAAVWTEELARWIWVWMAFIATGEAERRNVQLRMGILAEVLLGRFRFVLFTLIDLVYLAVTCHLLWIGYQTVLRTWNNESVTLLFSDAVLYASYPVAALFVIWRVASRIRWQLIHRSPFVFDPEGEQ